MTFPVEEMLRKTSSKPELGGFIIIYVLRSSVTIISMRTAFLILLAVQSLCQNLDQEQHRFQQ